ncbi:MAG: YaiI/YqxD family protein [Candidatus Omnitrophota bacterium]
MTTLYVDSDACPVKPEAVRVAKRYGLAVTFVSNSWMRLPEAWGARLVVVEGQFDAADDWIVGHVVKDDIVVTEDVPLAHRCIKAGARVIGPQGRLFTNENIGNLLATRDLLHVLRGSGELAGGPAPFQKEDRSRFLQGLDQIVQDIKNQKTV